MRNTHKKMVSPSGPTRAFGFGNTSRIIPFTNSMSISSTFWRPVGLSGSMFRPTRHAASMMSPARNRLTRNTSRKKTEKSMRPDA